MSFGLVLRHSTENRSRLDAIISLFFLFCHVHRQCFGEGLNWAGCTLIALLGQENRFEALDFCYHIVKVYAVDSRDEVVGGVVSEQSVDIFWGAGMAQ